MINRTYTSLARTKRRMPSMASAFFALLLIGALWLIPHEARAAIWDGTIKLIERNVFEYLFSMLGEAILTVTSVFLAACAVVLNFSLNLTLQIRQFVENIPAIYAVWRAIRDLSGMFIIFFLLYASIRMILGFDAKLKNLVVNIVIAGVLVNFSFFIVGVMIDASNIVSMQLFRQMTPNVIELQPGQNLNEAVQESIKQGSIADVFMNSLNITQIYEKRQDLINAGQVADKTPAWVRTLIIAFMGGAMMITTGLSFLFASLVFIVRLAVLIFLLGFSPIWFAAYIIPDLKEYANKGAAALKGQLLIMPIYLLLMYFALRVVGESNFTGRTLGAAAGQTFWESFLGLIGNYVFVIVMLNIPLLAALKLGLDNKMLKKLGGSMGAGAIWQKVGSWAGSRTVGRAAYSLNESGMMKSVASRVPLVGALANKGLSSVSSAGFGGGKKAGYSERLKNKKKAQEGLHKHLGSVDRGDYNTEAEYEAAQKRAAAYQAQYRTNLPWKGPVGGVIGFMVDNRANRQTAQSLTEEADLKKNQEERTAIESSDNFKYLEKREREGGNTFTNAERAELAQLRRKVSDLTGAINRASGKKKERERKEALQEGFKEVSGEEAKKETGEGGGGGGDKKDDKK